MFLKQVFKFVTYVCDFGFGSRFASGVFCEAGLLLCEAGLLEFGGSFCFCCFVLSSLNC